MSAAGLGRPPRRCSRCLNLGLGLIILLPFFWMVSVSLKPATEPFAIPARLWPENPTLDNYVTAFRPEFRTYFLNSLIVSLSTVVITVTLALLAAYAFTRCPDAAARRWLMTLVIVAQMFPAERHHHPDLQDDEGGRPPQHLCLADHRLCHGDAAGGDLDAARLPGAACRATLEEAAAIDGAGPLRAFFEIIVPLCRPGIVATAVFVLIVTWQEFLFALSFTSTKEMRTLPVGMNDFIGQYGIRYGELMASSVLISLPVVVDFLPAATAVRRRPHRRRGQGLTVMAEPPSCSATRLEARYRSADVQPARQAQRAVDPADRRARGRARRASRPTAAVRVLILAGAGDRAFVAGADIAEYRGNRAAGLCRLPVRAAGGCSTGWRRCRSRRSRRSAAMRWAAASSWRSAATSSSAPSSARLGLPEGQLGLSPGGGGTQRLSRAVGQRHRLRHHACRPPHHRRARLCDSALPPSSADDEDLAAAALARAQAMLKLAPLAQTEMKRLIRQGPDAPLPVAQSLRAGGAASGSMAARTARKASTPSSTSANRISKENDHG